MKKIIILLIFVPFVTSISFSQTSNVKIMDLAVSLVQNTDTNIQTTNMVKYNIQFKVSNKANSNNLLVLFGTTSHTGNIITNQMNIIHTGGHHYINNNSKQTEIEGYNGNVEVEMTKTQSDAFKHLTLYIIDNNGNSTNKLYFNK